MACQKDQLVPALVQVGSSARIANYDSLVKGRSHVLPGIPIPIDTDLGALDTLLLLKNQYVVSYNRSFGRANWVGWHLQKNDLGDSERQNDFRPDTSLPVGWYQVKSTDYSTTDGFDRGHLCPSADRSNSEADNSSTFLMTNIIPQAPALNRGVWKELEAYCRELVEQGNELYIIAGGYGYGAAGTKGFRGLLSSGRVKPSRQCWKVILVLPEGSDDLKRINAKTTVIAVDMPNTQSVGEDWEDYILSVGDLEKVAHHSFLSALPASIQSALKAKKYTFPIVITPPTTTTSTLPVTVTVTPPITVTVSPPVTITVTPPITTTITPPVTVTSTPPNPGTVSSPPSTGDSKCGIYNGKQLYIGPKGGCYYINSNGNKTYVDRGYCSC